MGAIVAHSVGGPDPGGVRRRLLDRARRRRADRLRGRGRRRRARPHPRDAAGAGRGGRRRGGVTSARPDCRRPSAGRRSSTPRCAIFSARSYRGVTTAEIAREAGVSEPILYRHFASKRDLYLACLEEAWRSSGVLGDAVAAMGEPTWSRRAMAAFGLRAVKPFLAKPLDPGDHRGGRRPRDPRVPTRHVREIHDFVAEKIRRCQAEGGIPPDRDPRPRHGSSSRAACSSRSPTGSEASSTTRRWPDPAARHRWLAWRPPGGAAGRRGPPAPRDQARGPAAARAPLVAVLALEAMIRKP